MEGRIQDFIRALAARRRVLLLGGHAVIHHGLSRETKAAEIWLEPSRDAAAWSLLLNDVTEAFPECYLWDLDARELVEPDRLSALIEDLGVVRAAGLNLPLDVFCRPNNLAEWDFEPAWEQAHPLIDEVNLRVLDEVELIVTREDTPHQSDRREITFLEGRIRAKLAPLLAECLPEQARAYFARYADHVTCEAALKNPHPEVRALALEALHEFAAAHNPFAREILRSLTEDVLNVG
jgi:hypothetical protein